MYAVAALNMLFQSMSSACHFIWRNMGGPDVDNQDALDEIGYYGEPDAKELELEAEEKAIRAAGLSDSNDDVAVFADSVQDAFKRFETEVNSVWSRYLLPHFLMFTQNSYRWQQSQPVCSTPLSFFFFYLTCGRTILAMEHHARRRGKDKVGNHSFVLLHRSCRERSLCFLFSLISNARCSMKWRNVCVTWPRSILPRKCLMN